MKTHSRWGKKLRFTCKVHPFKGVFDNKDWHYKTFMQQILYLCNRF